jgi:hypothetical protein
MADLAADLADVAMADLAPRHHNRRGYGASLGVVARVLTGKNRIMIYGPKDDGTYVVEFRTAAGDVLAISIPRTEAHVIRHFQARMPYGLFVPDVNAD